MWSIGVKMWLVNIGYGYEANKRITCRDGAKEGSQAPESGLLKGRFRAVRTGRLDELRLLMAS